MEEKHCFSLSADEWQYLQRLTARDEMLASWLGPWANTHSERHSITLSRAEADTLRERLTTQLALIGFDENYEPTEEGRIIEDLIDKLFIP